MPSYARIIQLHQPQKNNFYQEQLFFRDGKVMLFKRADHKRPKWQARYRIDGRYKTVSLRTYDYEEAKTTALEEFDELRIMHKLNMPVFKRTFESVADEFVSHQLKRVEQGEITKYWGSTGKSIFKVWKMYLEGLDITKIPQHKLDGYIGWRRNNNKNGAEMRMETIVTEISYFRSCMIWAQERKYIGQFQMPVIKVPVIKSHNKSKRYSFTRREWANLEKYMNNWVVEASVSGDERAYRFELKTYIKFLFFTGLRPGSETKGLKWKDIELRENSTFIWVTGKRGSDECVAQPDVMRFMTTWRNHPKTRRDDELIFPGLHNSRGVTTKTKANVRKLFDEAGVRIGPNGTKRTLYCLRHTYITFALADGLVNIYDLAKNSRTSVEMIQKTYSDVKSDDYAERVVKRKTHKPIRTD